MKVTDDKNTTGIHFRIQTTVCHYMYNTYFMYICYVYIIICFLILITNNPGIKKNNRVTPFATWADDI